MATDETDMSDLDKARADAQLTLREREAKEESEGLVVEAEVISTCLAAFARLHPSRRKRVADYLRDRCTGLDYLELAARSAIDFKKMVDDARAETADLRRQLAAKPVTATVPLPTNGVQAIQWRCECGCRNVGIGAVVCAKCGKERP